jgi:hypothetical protein
MAGWSFPIYGWELNRITSSGTWSRKATRKAIGDLYPSSVSTGPSRTVRVSERFGNASGTNRIRKHQESTAESLDSTRDAFAPYSACNPQTTQTYTRLSKIISEMCTVLAPNRREIAY